jgi:hypothetical protein
VRRGRIPKSNFSIYLAIHPIRPLLRSWKTLSTCHATVSGNLPSTFPIASTMARASIQGVHPIIPRFPVLRASHWRTRLRSLLVARKDLDVQGSGRSETR